MSLPWLDAAADLTARSEPFVLVTVAAATGHTPRAAGTKMIVTADSQIGTVGGGNLELSAVDQARALLAGGADEPVLRVVDLNPRAGEFALQCCGGRVTLLLEPVPLTRPAVAIFGAGHVGWAVVEVLRPLAVQVALLDSRHDALDRHPAATPGQAATVLLRHVPVPESAIGDLAVGCDVLVMTHDHAEDLAIVDTALRRTDLGSVGLIGSTTKWHHFRRRLGEVGHDEDALARVTTPVGLPGIDGKEPAVIAVGVVAQLLARWSGRRAGAQVDDASCR